MINRFNEIDKALSAFSFSKLQEFFFILNILDQQNIVISEFKEYVIERQKNIQNDLKEQNKESVKYQLKWERKGKKCPDCNSTMNFYRVNTGPRDKVDGNYKAQWFCNNCYTDEYTIESYESIYASIMGNDDNLKYGLILNE